MQAVLLLLAALACLLGRAAQAQEAVFAPPRQLPEAAGSSDSDLEFRFARGLLAPKELCDKLKARPSRLSAGCEAPAGAEEAKKVWKRGDESSAWEALASLNPSDSASKALVDKIMDDALGSVNIRNGLLSFGAKTPGETTGRLIYACGRQPECLKRTLSAEERTAIVKFLLSAEPLTSGVALGLKAFSDFGVAAVSVQQDKISPTAKVGVSTLLGKPLKWKLGSASASIVSQTSDGVKVNFDSKQGKLAKVPVEFEIVDVGVKATYDLIFDVSADFNGAKIVVKERSTVKSEHSIEQYPAKVTQTINLNRGESLEAVIKVSSGGSPLCLEQVIFGFVGENGQEYLAPGSCSESDVRIVLPNNQKLAEELSYHTGLFDLVLIASDPRIKNPTKWVLGKVQLALSPPPEKKHEPLFTHHLLYESDTTLKALPEIHHQFRQPDRRAPIIISIAFSAIQVGFLIALIVNSLLLGFRPASILSNVQAGFFTFALALTESVFLWYWIGPAGAPNMENLAYKYIPPLLGMLILATRHVLTGQRLSSSSKKSASM